MPWRAVYLGDVVACPHAWVHTARALPCRLGLTQGDRVLLVFMPSLDFIVTFLACLRAGLVAVPVYPPDPRRARANIAAFAQVTSDCGAKLAISHGTYMSAVSMASLAATAKSLLTFGRSKDSGGTKSVDWPTLTWLDVSTVWKAAGAAVPTGAAGTAALPPPVPTDLAFLQYTSGSTSAPKGVMISHANLSHNLTTIIRSLRAGHDTVVASWLPQYHDMGLIGAFVRASAGVSASAHARARVAHYQACGSPRPQHVAPSPHA
ncbi:hypothetical protein EON62_02620, partial [archaeon]